MKNDPAIFTDRIRRAVGEFGRSLRLMEVCGTHTHAIARAGLRTLLAPDVELVSGPGCPVCVTSQAEIERIIMLAQQPGVTLCTFGDMIRVPGLNSSLEQERAAGADIRVVYSPSDALSLAETEPDREVVFLAVGFETTAPTTAAIALQAQKQNIANFALLSLHKVVPPAMAAVLDGGSQLDGFLTPGHVSVIIGAKAYEKLALEHSIPCVVTGFDPLDVLEGMAILAEKISQREPGSFIQYKRAVTQEGNHKARETMAQAFEEADSDWRGLGMIPASGLQLKDELSAFDAIKRFSLPEIAPIEIPGCRCGEVLRGLIDPTECGLFGEACSPRTPVGPCMVSSEGSCAARCKYG